MNKYGLQLFSVRDLTGTDMASALKQVAELGYDMVEFAGFSGHSADEIAAMLKENGLECFGTHTGIGDLINDFDGTVAYHKAIGNKNYIIPCHDLSDRARIDEFVELVNKYQPMLEKEGIKLSYHNHSNEFVINADGSNIYQSLVERTNIGLEIDTFWAFNAGLDPIATLEKYADRLTCIHLKDGFKQTADKGPCGMPLGKGEAPVAAVRAKAVEMGLPIIVESETLTPSGVEEAKICIEYLKTLG